MNNEENYPIILNDVQQVKDDASSVPTTVTKKEFLTSSVPSTKSVISIEMISEQDTNIIQDRNAMEKIKEQETIAKEMILTDINEKNHYDNNYQTVDTSMQDTSMRNTSPPALNGNVIAENEYSNDTTSIDMHVSEGKQVEEHSEDIYNYNEVLKKEDEGQMIINDQTEPQNMMQEVNEEKTRSNDTQNDYNNGVFQQVPINEEMTHNYNDENMKSEDLGSIVVNNEEQSSNTEAQVVSPPPITLSSPKDSDNFKDDYNISQNDGNSENVEQSQGNYSYALPKPTPIRPLHGDPRANMTNTSNNYTNNQSPSHNSHAGNNPVMSSLKVFEHQTNAPSFYSHPNGDNLQAVSQPSENSSGNTSISTSNNVAAANVENENKELKSSPSSAPLDNKGPLQRKDEPQKPQLPPPAFAAHSLTAQMIDNNIYRLPSQGLSNFISQARSVTTPSQAMALAVDALRATVDKEITAHAWKVPLHPNEYDILLQKGSVGLCMNMSVQVGLITVTSFRRPAPDIIGPAEASGIIQVGDDLIAVDGFMVNSPEDFTRVVSRLKSLRPVLLRFRRSKGSIVPNPQNSVGGLRFGQSRSVIGLDNSQRYTAGVWHLGVRYIGPYRWAAELHLEKGGIRHLGVFSMEQAAALQYNRYIHRAYGDQAVAYMNPAAKPNGNVSSAQMSSQGTNPAVANNFQQLPQQRGHVAKRSRVIFTQEQKEQLRAQIMVFKFTASGGNIPADLLKCALGALSASNQHIIPQDSGAKKRKKNFSSAPVGRPKAGSKRKKIGSAQRKKKKKSAYSDEDSEESDDGGRVLSTEAIRPSRRSDRNVGKAKKSYAQDEADLDFNVSEDEKDNENSIQEREGKLKGPQIDKILSLRFRKESVESEEVIMEFLIKWKDVSYLHLSWLTVREIENFGHHSVMRMRRYLQRYSREVEHARDNVVIGNNSDTSDYFDEEFVQVDRILGMKDVDEPIESNPYVTYLQKLQLENDKLRGDKNLESNDNTQSVRDPDKKAPQMSRGKKYLVKWRGLSYFDCTWEWESELTDDRKIAAYLRYIHPPIVNGAHAAMLQDVRPPPSAWAKYSESPTYNNQNKLRSYQLEGLNWMSFCWYNRRNCILADEMGLGKTVQATSILEHLRQREHIRGPFLVVAPLVTLGNWKREIESWTTMNCVVYHDSDGGAETRAFIRKHEFYYENDMYRKRGIYKFNVLVTSYQTLMTDAEFLEPIHWRYLVVDEAHKLKNRETKLLQCLQQFTFDSCLLMTGTPLQNGVFELWCLLNFIEPEKFPSQQEFYDNYGDLSTAEQVAQLHEQLRPYMLRRVKEDVEKSIPPKEETIVDVELTTLQKKYYRAIFERNRDFLNAGAAGSTVANLVNVEMELRKCCNHPFMIKGVEEKECRTLDEAQRAKILVQASGKTVLLDKILAKFYSEKKKVLIFSQFKIMLDIIEDLCHLRAYGIERLDGSVRGSTRQAAIDRFNKPGSDTFVFLLSTRAGGVGINLVAASVVILFDSDWNPQNDLQAVARCHRIGQTKAVSIYRLVTKKTYEAQMFDIASRKLGMHHAVFETGGVRNEFDGDDEGGNMMSLLSLDREKVESMIRYGAYAIMDTDESEQDPENRAINELDIDQLLSSSRTIRYDPSAGEGVQPGDGEDGDPDKKQQATTALSFSKASFTAETSDTTIDFNDDQFWEKVLGPKPVQLLMSKVQEGYLLSQERTLDEIKDFLLQLRELARAVVEERQKGGSMAEADQVTGILIELKVTGPVIPDVVNVRKVAAEWLEVIERPKRRRNQDLESELMYMEFLDGTDENGVVTPRTKKKKTKKKKRPSNGTMLDDERSGEFEVFMEEESGPKRKKKSISDDVNSGIRITLRNVGDRKYIIAGVHSSNKAVRKKLPKIAQTQRVNQSKYSEGRSNLSSDAATSANPNDGGFDELQDNDEDVSMSAKHHPDEEEEEDVDEDDEDEIMTEDEEDDDEDSFDGEDDYDDGDDDTPKKKKPTRKKKKNSRKQRDHYQIDPQLDDEMWCRVCFSDQGFLDDPIVQCEKCDVAVHKFCYGIQVVPEGEAPWYCDRCAEHQGKNIPVEKSCKLCPLTRNSSAFKKTIEGDWVHVVCALWAPGVQFSDVERMAEVSNVPGAVEAMKGAPACKICKKESGCIKCFRSGCHVHFHPLCGRESKGLYDMFMKNGGQLQAFCPKHKSRAKRL